MLHKKKISVVLLIAFVLTMIVSGSAFASNFSDIPSNHWASQQIDRMNARGVIGGYEDGTVRADNSVTQFEAVLMASRMMGLEYDESKSKGTYLPFAYPSWNGAYNSAVVAYEAGLIDTADFKYDSPASREWITKLLIKVLKAESQLGNSTSTLPFSDSASIGSSYKSYVLLAYDKKLIGGYTDGTFKPANTVTRAELAAFLCRVENQLDVKANNLILGTVESISGVSITIVGQDGTKRTVYATTNSNLYDASGNKIGVTGLKAGDAVYAVFTNSLLNYLEVRTNVDYGVKENVSTVIGEIASIISAKKTIVVNDEKDTLKTIVLDGNTVIAYDNDSTKLDFSDLTTGMNVRVKVNDGTQTATEVAIEKTSDGQKSGTVYNVDVYDNLITMNEKTGLVTYRMSKNIDVSVSGMLTATTSSLKEGNQATYTISDGVMVAIAVGGSSDNYGGNATIQAIDTTGKIITYKTTAGDLKAAYYTNGQTVTFNDGTEGSVTDLMVNDSVTITVSGNNVVAIKVTNRKMAEGIKGTLYSVNTANNYIIITNSNGTRDTYDLFDNVKVTLYGESASLSSLDPGMNVELTISNNKVTRIKANDLITGTVKAVNTSAKTITITGTDGANKTYDVASSIVVYYYQSTGSRLSAVNVGDVVSVRMKDNEVTAIYISSEVDMTVNSVYSGSGYCRLVDNSGNYKTAYVDDIELYVDGVHTTDLSKVYVGDGVTATFYGSTLQKVVVSSGGTKGRVTAVNTSTNTITIKPFNSDTTTTVTLTNGSYISRNGSTSTSISSISKGDRVLVTPISGTAKSIAVMKEKTGKVRYNTSNMIAFQNDDTWYYTISGVYCHYQDSTATFTMNSVSGSNLTGESVTIYYTDASNVYEVEWNK